MEFAIEAVSKAPTEYNEFYWWAFNELITERPIGMSAGPIPYSSIVMFCNEYNITGYQKVVFSYVIRGLDNKHLEFLGKQLEQANKPKR